MKSKQTRPNVRGNYKNIYTHSKNFFYVGCVQERYNNSKKKEKRLSSIIAYTRNSAKIINKVGILFP